MLRSALVGVLLLALGVLGGVLLERRTTLELLAERPAAGSAISWTTLSPDDRRIAAIFGIAQIAGVRAAIDSLDALARVSPGIRTQGHAIAHALGRFAVDRAHGNPAVFAECRELFQAGCYHGVLEGYFATRPTADSAAITGLCAAVAQRDAAPLVLRECAHGLGHGLLGYHEGRTTPALSACDWLAGESPAECHRGVFMERLAREKQRPPAAGAADASNEHHAHAGGADVEAGAHEPAVAGAPGAWCDGITDRYRAACWWYVPQLSLQADRATWAPTARVCDAAPAAVRAVCYRGVGNAAAGLLEATPERAVELCVALSGNARQACIAGAAEQHVDMDWSGTGARRFCALVSEGDRPACGAAIDGRMELIARADSDGRGATS